MKTNYTLFIDTTNNFCYIGLYKSNDLLDYFRLQVNKNVTDIIVDSINKLLINNKVKNEQLTHMCVNVGPGSFTGVKVGVIVAKTWKMWNPKIKISTINSLLLQTTVRPSISVIDAKSKKLYFAIYDKTKVLVKPCLIDASELDKYTKKYKKFTLVQDKIDDMYSNFLLHKKDFKEVKNIDKLEPLYLKNPV